MTDDPTDTGGLAGRLGALGKKVRSHLPEIALPDLPSLGKDVALPVYVIHNSTDPEDYFFIFDFEQFVEQTRAGVFVRPRLDVWAGRDDFDRAVFARQFRQSFAREFEIARLQLAHQSEKSGGWFSFLRGTFGDLKSGSLSGFAANVILLVATSAGQKLLGQILPQRWLAGKSDTAKLEQNINETQTKVDTALAGLEIRVHGDLQAHAFPGNPSGPRAPVDENAWPLPAYVAEHLGDGVSGSWW